MRVFILVLAACATQPAVSASAPPPETEPAAIPPGAAPPEPEPAARGKRASRHGTPDEIAFCVAETNRYRARARRPPFARSARLDEYAAAGAESDTHTRKPHNHFSTARYPERFSGLAENELPWWRIDPGGSVESVIRAGIASMWAEGPGGGHYENLIGPFTEMGCGIYVLGDEVTVVQDFRYP